MATVTSKKLHTWSLSPREAVELQRELAPQVIRTGSLGKSRLLAGADLAFTADGSHSVAGVVIWDSHLDEIVEQVVVKKRVTFPYVPGLLSFREAPALLAAFERIKSNPGVVFFDGHGLAHPRRFGLACHMGLWLDRPSLGCGKSLLVGEHDEPGVERGSMSPLVHKGETIGMAVRTRDRVKPIYVSVGHKVSLGAAVDAVLRACTRYRLPEPTRLADKLVARAKLDAR